MEGKEKLRKHGDGTRKYKSAFRGIVCGRTSDQSGGGVSGIGAVGDEWRQKENV